MLLGLSVAFNLLASVQWYAIGRWTVGVDLAQEGRVPEAIQRASLITMAMSGISASAWPRAIGSDRLFARLLSVSKTAAEQASSAVSMARTRIGGNSLTVTGLRAARAGHPGPAS